MRDSQRMYLLLVIAIQETKQFNNLAGIASAVRVPFEQKQYI